MDSDPHNDVAPGVPASRACSTEIDLGYPTAPRDHQIEKTWQHITMAM